MAWVLTGSGMPITADIATAAWPLRRLHFARADPVPGARDHVVGTANVPDIAVCVAATRSPVSSQSPGNFSRVASGLPQYSSSITGSGRRKAMSPPRRPAEARRLRRASAAACPGSAWPIDPGRGGNTVCSCPGRGCIRSGRTLRLPRCRVRCVPIPASRADRFAAADHRAQRDAVAAHRIRDDADATQHRRRQRLVRTRCCPSWNASSGSKPALR